ncbi:MAG: sugar kinase [Myxococcales bacterium]|nr:MAG: sugar kinase [Myxococcales bacterium]
MKKTVAFGEVLLRLSPPGNERFLQSPQLSASFGGGEANVALSLAGLGLASSLVTRLPAHAIGEAALRSLRAEGVDTRHVVRGGERLGIYYAENGVHPRASTVVYDRAHSSITELEPSAVDWDRVFQGAHWFHVSGITPALGAKPQACTLAALEAAKRAGVTVSFGVHYRAKLWEPDEAQHVLRPLLSYVDLVFANEDDIRYGLGVVRNRAERTGETGSTESYRQLAERVATEFGIQMVAMTVRDPVSASDCNWSGLLYEHGSNTLFQSKQYQISLVEPIGASDAFTAGLIYAVLAGRSAERALAFAVGAGALKHTIPGDFNRVSAADVDRLTTGDSGLTR